MTEEQISGNDRIFSAFLKTHEAKVAEIKAKHPDDLFKAGCIVGLLCMKEQFQVFRERLVQISEEHEALKKRAGGISDATGGHQQ